jgi:protease-4
MTGVDEGEVCSVARIPLQGVLVTTSGGYGDVFSVGMVTAADSVAQQVQEAEDDESISAIVVDIDSPGGTPLAGDEMARAFSKATKPTVAVIRDMGTSAAYWAAAGTDYIIASPVSDVGSIGVTMSYTELAGANTEEGSRWVGISSGTFKDAGNPERELTEEEQAYFQSQVDAVHGYMVDRIATLRPRKSREEYAALADGKAYLGSDALGLGLIDALGGLDDAQKHIEQLLGAHEGSAVLCSPHDTVWEELF